jgi:hypothetical protein
MNKLNLTRRHWMSVLPFAGAAAAMALRSQSEPETRFDQLTADQSPVVGVSHLGFLPTARKRIIVRDAVKNGETLTLLTPDARNRTLNFLPPATYDLGPGSVADFSDVVAPGTYQAIFRGQQSVPFVIGSSVWQQALAVLATYQGQQRCGGVTNRPTRPSCHLDDARRRDNGGRVDTVGGWHDAGDLRKWVDSTLMNLFGLLSILRNLRSFPSSGPLSRSALLSEVKYGNSYFLKMQDSDGLVWADVAGGTNGNNSDNHWTDNVAGTADDRWINTDKKSGTQAMFVMAEALTSEAFSAPDPSYSTECMNAAVRCWSGSNKTGPNTVELAWWVMAATEMYRITGNDVYRDELIRLANQVASLQFASSPNPLISIRGYFPMWPGNIQPLRDPVHSALPAYCLLRASKVIEAVSSLLSSRWLGAAKLYLDGYVLPMAAKSAYSIIPYGIYPHARTPELYRPLAGGYSYRFFMPTRDSSRLWAGLNSHLLGHALLLLEAEGHFGDSRYRDLAFSQLEWVFGANPFAASLATGLGSRQPVPFSPFVGPITGGIMNGICGDDQDRPILDSPAASDWHSNEYWSPHVGYCQWVLSTVIGGCV